MLLNDGARGSFVGRHQHPGEHRRDGDTYVINGRKWWSTGAMTTAVQDCHCHGQDRSAAPKHKQQSMILVPLDTPGVTVERPLSVFGYDDAPHGHAEIMLRERARAGVQHPSRRGSRIRDRPGPAWAGPHPPLHARSSVLPSARWNDVPARPSRVAFGKPLAEQGTMRSAIAEVAMRDRDRRGC